MTLFPLRAWPREDEADAEQLWRSTESNNDDRQSTKMETRKTPDRLEYRMIAGGRHITTVFKEDDENWYITESDGWPTMAEAKDFAENILD